MPENKIETTHKYHDKSVVFVCDVVKIDNKIYTVRFDKKFHPTNTNEKIIFSTSKLIKKIGTIEEYPEYFI